MNQTICNASTAALIDSGSPKTFWTEAMSLLSTPLLKALLQVRKEKHLTRPCSSARLTPHFFTPFAVQPMHSFQKTNNRGNLGARVIKLSCLNMNLERRHTVFWTMKLRIFSLVGMSNLTKLKRSLENDSAIMLTKLRRVTGETSYITNKLLLT
jgi:hypothetical protein